MPLEREVLARNRKALVIMGMNYVTRGGDRRGDPDLTTMIEKHAHHSTYVVLLGGMNPSTEPALHGAEPILYLRGSPLGQVMISGRRAEDAADAFLYLRKTPDPCSPTGMPCLPTRRTFRKYSAGI